MTSMATQYLPIMLYQYIQNSFEVCSIEVSISWQHSTDHSSEFFYAFKWNWNSANLVFFCVYSKYVFLNKFHIFNKIKVKTNNNQTEKQLFLFTILCFCLYIFFPSSFLFIRQFALFQPCHMHIWRLNN